MSEKKPAVTVTNHLDVPIRVNVSVFMTTDDAGTPTALPPQFVDPGRSAGFSVCKPIDDLPHLGPGWLCCACKGYCGAHRTECRFCGHTYCGPAAKEKA